jgi:hypothetical protein
VLTACLIIISVAISQIAFADTNEDRLIGIWEGGDSASHAIYGTLVMTKDRISWGKEKSDPGCEGRYFIVAKDYAVTFPDAFPNPYADSRQQSTKKKMYHIIKIKITQNTCIGVATYLQFAFPSNSVRYVDVVEYNEANRPEGWIHFLKQQEHLSK